VGRGGAVVYWQREEWCGKRARRHGIGVRGRGDPTRQKHFLFDAGCQALKKANEEKTIEIVANGKWAMGSCPEKGKRRKNY
jgi:hypothetical protein